MTTLATALLSSYSTPAQKEAVIQFLVEAFVDSLETFKELLMQKIQVKDKEYTLLTLAIGRAFEALLDVLLNPFCKKVGILRSLLSEQLDIAQKLGDERLIDWFKTKLQEIHSLDDSDQVEMTSRCAFCKQQNRYSVFFLCSKCRTVFYCNEDCQRAHWKNHKPECKGRSGASGGASHASFAGFGGASSSH